MSTEIDMNQLRADLDNLSAQDFEIKYPGLKSKSLKNLHGEELEQRVSKTFALSVGINRFLLK